MQRQIGATILVAGTCIGGGMIALPMVLAKIGIIPSIVVMLMTWMLVYYTSIINLELHLQAGKGLTLGELGRKFSGKIAGIIGTGSFKLLSYSLVAVYIYAGSSVAQSMLEIKTPFESIAAIYAVAAALLLMLPLKVLDYVNRILFIGLLVVIASLVIGLVFEIKWHDLPLISNNYKDIVSWEVLIPVVFTSFGFQGSIPPIVNYCNGDKKMLKKVFFWGTLTPTIVYIIWTCSVLGVVHADNHEFYNKISNGEVDVGGLVSQLSHVSQWDSVQALVWWISFFAIVTSLLGVSISLCDSVKSMMPTKLFNSKSKIIIAPILTVLPAYLVAMIIPNAFISVLGFAGMILVIIAILLPVYLLRKAKSPICKELKHQELISLTTIIGVVIILCEILNML